MENKIYIIGGLRSGKSFMGNELSKKTGIHHFDLDELVFIKIGVEERDEESRNKELENILARDKWIIEGTYTEKWILPALARANIIIWLDTPARIKLFRFLKQIIKNTKNRKNFYGRGKLAIGLKYKEWDRSRQAYKTLLQPFQSKVIILKSKVDIRIFLERAESIFL